MHSVVERAILNVIQNALRHSHHQVDITINKDNNSNIVVDDDGPGIAEQYRQQVFQSFVQLTNTNKQQTSEFELGLAICRRIILWHQGAVSVSQSPCGGARFVMTWPQHSE